MKTVLVTAGPPGSHAVSGSWRGSSIAAASDNQLTETFKLTNGTLTMSQPTGQSYTANLDGTDAPYQGDPGVTSVSIVRRDRYTIVESDKRNGKVIAVYTMTITPDGKTLNVAWEDKLRGSTGSYKANKQ